MRPLSQGQASVELIVILGMTLLVVLVFAVLSSDLLSDINVQKNYNDAGDSVQKLANAADIVYAQGEGASMTVRITLPTNTNFGANSTFIGKPANAAANVTSNQVNINVEGTDVSAFAKETVTGSFPTSPGVYLMKVTSKGSYVAIGTHYLDASKQSVFESMARSENRTETITFTAASNESVTVTLNYTWGYANINLSSDTLSFTAAPGSPVTANLTFTSNSAAGGIYNGELKVTGTVANTGVRESFTIPIAADVQAG